MNRAISTRLSGSSLALTFLLVLAISVAGDLVFQALIGIPERTVQEQSRTALRLLRRQADALQGLVGGPPGPMGTALAIEASHLYLHNLRIFDPDGRLLATIGPASEGAPAPLSTRETPGPTRYPGPEPHLQLDQETGLLRASLAVAGPPGDALADPPAALLELEWDLRAAERAAWEQRLSLQGWRPWLIWGGAALFLALLAGWWQSARLRRRRRADPRAVGESVPTSGISGPGEAADPAIAPLSGPPGGHDASRRLAEARLAYALDGPGEGLWDWDMTTDRVYYSPRWKANLGYAEDALGDRRDEWVSRIHPDDLETCRAALERHRTGASPYAVCEHRLRCQDGSWRWMLERGRILEWDADGRAVRMIGTHADITERKQAERSLTYVVTLETVLVEASRALLTAQPEAVDQVLDRVLGALARRMDLERACLYQLSNDGQALRATHEWCAVDVPERRVAPAPMPVETLPRWMETLRHGEDIRIGDVNTLPDAWGLDRRILLDQGIRAALAVPLRAGERLAGCVVAEMEGTPRAWRDSEVRALRILGDLIGAAFERRKIAQELVEVRQRLEEAALYDTLTGLPNRRLLAERMHEAMGVAVESGTELAVCYLDLDGFKPVNDAYGQEVGDQILMAVGARLREQVRESDTVARLGGDEFVLLLGGLESPVECANLLDRLIKLLAQPYTVAARDLRVTASIGVTLYPWDANDADTLLRHADHAMYRAKQRGRNRCRFFDPIRDRRANDRRSQLERIGEAIDGGELVLYYQPKVDMRSRQVIGAEALVRWQHPDKGLLPPGAFIPLLDGTEYQQRLDWWVVKEGLNQLQAWRDLGLDLSLSLNISARSVQHEGFVDNLGEQLRGHPGLAPDALSLEILESEALVDLEAVARVIEHCAGLGVRFALDDFGTGYSSLTYFRRLPAQVLKIDQTFVRDMLRSPDDRNIVEGVIGLAHAFQREVIAEGVESAAHGLMLLRMGCDRAQGYGIAEPMPAQRLPGWVKDYCFPPLWGVNPEFEWSEHILDLLTRESEYRDWVASLIRTATATTPARHQTLEDGRGAFGRWYYGEGSRQHGHLDLFRRLEPLHQAVHERGRALLRTQDQGQPLGAGVGELLADRDRFICALHELQECVLSQAA